MYGPDCVSLTIKNVTEFMTRRNLKLESDDLVITIAFGLDAMHGCKYSSSHIIRVLNSIKRKKNG